MTQTGKAVLGAAVLMLAVWMASKQFQEKSSPAATGRSPQQQSPTPVVKPSAEEEHLKSHTAYKRRVQDDWASILKWLSSTPRPTEEELQARFLATRIAWAEMDPQALAAAIQALLETGVDATTGLDFQVGLHGLLVGWPTLRVFLLDILAASDPEMASTIASQLLDTTNSADEFATALKSLTRDSLGQADDAALLARFDQMLGHSDWQTSRGFAEAFDLARFIGTPEAALRLATWDGNPQLKAMAMDEFTAEHPEAMMEILNSDSPVSGTPRANIMARADPSSSTQLESVDAYLRRPDLTPEEAATFLKSFPLRSATTGFRLYGKTPSPYTLEQIKAGDLAARELVEEWLVDSALDPLRLELLSLQARLTKWVQQAE